jgi:hypothetical protein
MDDARVGGSESDVLLMSLAGLVSQNSQEDVVVQGITLSRGDKRRNARLARLPELVPKSRYQPAQAIVLTDHDSQALVRTRVKAKAWRPDSVLDWARTKARELGFVDVDSGLRAGGASLADSGSACCATEYDVGVRAAAADQTGP